MIKGRPKKPLPPINDFKVSWETSRDFFWPVHIKLPKV